MLRKNVTRAVRPMLNGMIRRGVGIEALEETPIADLVELSQPDVTDEEVEAITASEAPVDAVLDLVESTSEITNSHAAYVDQLIEQGSAAVAATIEKARDVVMPAIAKITDSVVNKVDRALTPRNDLMVFEIPAFVTSTTINSLFAQYENAGVEVVTISDLPQFTSEQLTQLLETGNAETNEQIATHLAGMPEGALEVIIADVIRGAQPEVSGYVNAVRYGNGATAYIARDINVMPAVVIAAVILRNLYDNPPAGINASIIAWNEHVVSAMSGLAANYHVLMENIATYVSSGQLYLPSTLRQESPAGSDQFPILDRVYDKFLDSDGFPELLFALTINGNNLRADMASVLEGKELLSSQWAGYVHEYRNRAMSDLSTRARDIVYSEIGILLNELDLSELAVEPATIWEAIREAGDDEKFTPENLYTIIRFLVAGVLFARYQTLPLLMAMDKHMDQNKDCSPRVAAYHGAKAYVCQWVADQLTKVKA